ncbi:MAG: TonB-dependent receptor [Acidobacteria bacterium]|nr:TonB-dependent receptor [Acidobacteriota bacterium]
MYRRLFVLLLLLAAILALPSTGHAQEAVILGTVTDSTGGVLPGVTVTATHTATGNTFFSVTDERGVYRIPARIGSYQLSAELAGFSTVTRTGITLLVGQEVAVNLQMSPSGVQETVTVTADAPLISTTQSQIGSNIDPRQVEELPVQGRQWTALALLAPGNRTTEIGENPAQDRSDVREFQLNMDGQQVTHNTGTGGQVRYSRDAIAEFQFISNRFDATQGRSSGVQVNAVSKSGTNQYAGTFSGTFRNDRWNARSFIDGRRIPFKNQQISGTFGGPILEDKFHFFGNTELDRTPKSLIWRTGYATFDAASRDYTDTIKMGGLRLDYQVSPQMRLFSRGSVSKDDTLTANETQHPAAAQQNFRTTNDLILAATNVLNNTTINEVRVGYAAFHYGDWNLGFTPNFECFFDAARTIPCTVPNGRPPFPRITLQGFATGGNQNGPRKTSQNQYTVRNDFTTSYELGGRHTLKAGGEYLYMIQGSGNCRRCSTVVTANLRPLSTLPKSIDQYLGGGPGQDLYDSSTWDLNALSSLVRRTQVGIGPFLLSFNRHIYAGWLQDDWQVNDRLTLNLGVRYDLIANAFANQVEMPPFLEEGRPNDNNNVQPRVGFAYKVDDRTVLRGGVGRYYGDTQSNMLSFTYSFSSIALVEYPNDGRADFFRNPWNGPKPSRDEALQRFCSENGNRPGCLLRAASELAPYPGYGMDRIPNSWQSSIGVQRQIGNDMAVEIDYIRTNSRNEKTITGNINLAYNAATGENLPYSNRATRPFPDWGIVGMTPHAGWSNYHGLQTAFTKRFSNRWQASANYLLSQIEDSLPNPVSGLTGLVPFSVAPDLGEDYGRAETDQRHRFTVNGIWEVYGGFQVSGLYFYGSGMRLQLNTGNADTRDLGDAGDYENRRRANGDVVPRNGLDGPNHHRVDIRLQQRIPVGTRMRLDGQLEIFNVFNRFNYSQYTTDELSIRFGQPLESNNIAFRPRMLQLGFRLAF